MSVSLDKITSVTFERQNMIYRGTPIRLTGQLVTVKITKAWGLGSAIDYTWAVRGCKITVPRSDCDLFRR